MIPQKIRNGVDSMKSLGIYAEKTNSSGVKATKKVGKHTLPNKKINMAICIIFEQQKREKEKKNALQK